MLVYRICNEKEKDLIEKEESFSDIGKVWEENEKKSTHTYEKEKKYLHFFKNYDGVFLLKTTQNHYICTYDFEESLLEESKGIGYYWDRLSFKSIEKVEEYAIPSEKIQYDNLLKMDRITEEIDFEEYVDNSFIEKLETIYEKEKPKVLKKENKKPINDC